jgi:hypothetical protein
MDATDLYYFKRPQYFEIRNDLYEKSSYWLYYLDLMFKYWAETDINEPFECNPPNNTSTNDQEFRKYVYDYVSMLETNIHKVVWVECRLPEKCPESSGTEYLEEGNGTLVFKMVTKKQKEQ